MGVLLSTQSHFTHIFLVFLYIVKHIWRGVFSFRGCLFLFFRWRDLLRLGCWLKCVFLDSVLILISFGVFARRIGWLDWLGFTAVNFSGAWWAASTKNRCHCFIRRLRYVLLTYVSCRDIWNGLVAWRLSWLFVINARKTCLRVILFFQRQRNFWVRLQEYWLVLAHRVHFFILRVLCILSLLLILKLRFFFIYVFDIVWLSFAQRGCSNFILLTLFVLFKIVCVDYGMWISETLTPLICAGVWVLDAVITLNHFILFLFYDRVNYSRNTSYVLFNNFGTGRIVLLLVGKADASIFVILPFTSERASTAASLIYCSSSLAPWPLTFWHVAASFNLNIPLRFALVGRGLIGIFISKIVSWVCTNVLSCRA